MKIPRDAYDEKQLEALARHGVVFDFDKDYSDDELCNIEDKIGDMVMDHASFLDDMPDSKRDFWESLIDTFVTLQDDE